MYEAWHGPAVAGLKDPTTALTVERVLQSNGQRKMADMAAGIDLGTAMNFYFHKEPADGFYCIYRKRTNEAKGPIPDCSNITATLTRHAAMLTAASVDFVVADSTNVQNKGTGADLLQLRPFEVLAEEWLGLRQSGVPTPSLAIWQNLQDPNGDLWRAYVDEGGVYTNPAYKDMIFTDSHTGKKVFFTTSDPHPSLVATLEGPPYNLAVVTMWAERWDGFEKGEWTFFSPCTDGNNGFTSTVYTGSDKPCNQKLTINSNIGAHGTSITVSPSYQLSYSSLPFQASGKLGGLTLKKQFEKAFQQEIAGSLDYLMVGTFNEHIAQPQPNPFNPPNKRAISMGLEDDSFDSYLWVDLYGDAITRDLEPTKEDGGLMWKLFLSCMRVFKSQNPDCQAHTNEDCCVLTQPASDWHQVWSLHFQQKDFLLTTDQGEKDALTSKGWQEICAPHGGSSAFCSQTPDSSLYSRGPFLLHSQQQQDTPVYRCITPLSTHLFTADANCLGRGKVEALMGFASKSRSSNTPRSLRSCLAGSVYYHNLDAPCEPNDQQLDFIGFVH